MYKEATINPTNLRDRAEGWEVDVVSHFSRKRRRQGADRRTPSATGAMLYLARPLRITDGNVSHATARWTLRRRRCSTSTVRRMVSAGKFKDVIGAQIVSVPYALPLERANIALRSFLYLLVGVFVFLFVTVNFLSTRWS